MKNKPEPLKIAHFRFALIAPVIQGLYPDASEAAYYRRVTQDPILRPTVSPINTVRIPLSAGPASTVRKEWTASSPDSVKTKAFPGLSPLMPSMRSIAFARSFPASTAS